MPQHSATSEAVTTTTTDPAQTGTPPSRNGNGLTQGILSDVVGYRIVQASLATGDTYRQHIGEPLELRKVEYSLMMLLDANGHATPKQLAANLALSSPNLTILLDRMQERGLIDRERSDTDRRSQHVRLTDAGTALTKQALACTVGMEQSLDGVLSKAERGMLLELLGKVAKSRRVAGG